MPASNATSRFSDRVENYVRYRPGYPPEALQILRPNAGSRRTTWLPTLPPAPEFGRACCWRMATACSESNPTPRCARRASACWRNFRSSPALRERRKRPRWPTRASISSPRPRQRTGSIAQRARREFVRILKPGGWLVLLWNERLTDSTPFLRDYEQLLLTYGTDYARRAA